MRFEIFGFDKSDCKRQFVDKLPDSDADAIRYTVDIPDAYSPRLNGDGHIVLTRGDGNYLLNNVIFADDINQPIISWGNVDVKLEVLAVDDCSVEPLPIDLPYDAAELIDRFGSMGLHFSIHPETGRLVIRPDNDTARFVRKTFPAELETIRFGLRIHWNQLRYSELARQQAKRKAAEEAAEKDGE